MKTLSKLKIGLIIIAASLVLFLLAFFYYKSESGQIIKEKHEFLEAVTNIKLEQILNWRTERIRDAEFFPTIREIIKSTEELKESKTNKDAYKYFSNTLKRFKDNGYFDNVFITDVNGSILFSLDSSFNTIDQLQIEELKHAVKKDSVIIGEFYFCNTHKTIHFNVASVIKDNFGNQIGVYVQVVDPYKSLYPLIQSWPVSSKSAETLVFKKVGDQVVYINELRHKKNSALSLKIHITRSDIVAIKTVFGARGIIEGEDYRGKDVLADVKTVPGTDWFMVSKVDKEEIYSELFYRAGVVSLISLISILLISFAAFYIYKYQQSNIYKNLFFKEKELAETQEEYRTALYSIGDAVITTDIQGRIKQMNSVAETLTGWKENEVKGKSLSTVFNVINEATNKPVENPVTRVLRAGEVVGLANHTMLISKNGNKIPIADSGSPIKNSDGKIIGVVLVFRDQTEEREKEKVLIESEEKFRKAFTTSPDSININRLSDGLYITVNDGFTKMTGYRLDEVIGKSSLDINIWADVEDRKRLVAGLKEKGIVENLEARFRLKNGKVKSGLMSASIIQILGEPHILSITRDITERKIAEESLRKSEERYALVIDASNEGIFDWDVINDIAFVSEKFRQIYGLKGHIQKSMNEWISKVHPEDVDRITKDIENHYAGKTNISESEYRILDENGKYKWVLGRAKARFNTEGKPVRVVGTVRDISDKKHAEEAIKDSEANLNALINNNKESIWSIDKNYNYIVFNNFFAEAYFTAYNQKLVKGINALNILTPELKAIWKPKYDAALSGESVEFEFNYLLNNKLVYLQVFLNPIISDGEVRGVSALSVDITDKKLAEKDLRENQLRLQSIVSNAPVVLFGLDKNGIFTFSEGKGLESLGLKPGEVVGLSAFEMYKDHPAVLEAIRHTLMGEMNSAIHDLGDLVFDVYYSPLKDENEQISGLIGVATDITERIHAEQRIIESEKQLSTLVQGTKALLFSTDYRGRFVYVNQAVSELFEISIDELLGSFYLTFVHPEDRKRVHQQYYSQLKHSVKSTYSEFRYQSKNNKTGWLSFYVNPAIQEGKIVGLTGVAQDITERKQFQEALFKSEERLRLSLSAANQGLYDLNVQTGEAIVNDEYASMLGYDPKTFRESNENWIERLHPDDRESTAKAYLNYIEGKTSEYRVEFRQGTKNNEWKWILSLGKIIEYDAAGKPLRMLGTHTDMTEQKRLTLELIEAKEKAEEMNRVKAYFYANMSHELRTPFVGIMGYSEILSESLQNPAEKEMAVQILKSSKRLTDTLNKILNVTRLEFDKVDLKMSDVDVVELIKQQTILFSKSAFIKNTEIKTEFNPNIICVKTDGKLLEEILTNLLNNAVKFTENGLIKISAESMIENDEDYLILKVSDTGVGIPKEKHKIIWQEFRQASEGFNRSFEGTGLGLTIIKKYINTLGGKIILDSEVGEGATFTIKIPAKNLGKKDIIIRPEGVPEQPKIYNIPKNRKPKILYIEDDIIALSYVDKVLRNIYEIDTAFNAAIALDLAKKNRYEVLMLDINLDRGIDGIELMYMLRKIDGYAKIPMVAVTAYAANSDKAEFLAKGFTHYISKPFTSVELKNIISSIVS